MFNSPAELAVALEEGRKFKTKLGYILSYDSGNACPFRFADKYVSATLAMKDAWSQYNKVTEILKEVDWDKVPRYTPVLVRNETTEDSISIRFVIDARKSNYKFNFHTINDKNILQQWQYCRLDPTYPINEDWYK